jgi:hypothetical protein
LVLEEVHVPPTFLDRIVDSATDGCAPRAREPCTYFEINMHLQQTLVSMKVGSNYDPRRHQAKGGSEERIGVHANTMGRSLDGQLPTDLGTEPKISLCSEIRG